MRIAVKDTSTHTHRSHPPVARGRHPYPNPTNTHTQTCARAYVSQRKPDTKSRHVWLEKTTTEL